MISTRSADGGLLFRRPFLGTALLLLAVLAIAFALRFFFVRSLAEELPWPDSREYHVLALEMQHSWQYRDSSGAPAVYWPPGYPYFLGVVYGVFGPSIYAARVVQSVLGALTCLLCYLIAVRLLDRRSAALAAIFAAIYPLTVYTAATLYPATLQTFLLACVVYLCLLARSGQELVGVEGEARRSVSATLAGGQRSVASFFPAALSAGIIAAYSVLVSPASLPALVLAAVWLAWPTGESKAGPGADPEGDSASRWRGRATVRRNITLAVVFLIPLILVLGGWSYRNYRAFGRPIAISANRGFNFWLGNHPDVTPTTGNRMTPEMRKELGSVYAKYRNAAVRDSVLFEMGLHYASSDPGRFVRLSAGKAANFWRLYPQPMTGVQPAAGREKLLSILSYGVLLPFGIVWLFRSLQRSRGAWLILLFFITYTLVHSVFISKVRFRLPLDLYVIIYASGALIALLSFLRRKIRGGSEFR